MLLQRSVDTFDHDQSDAAAFEAPAAEGRSARLAFVPDIAASGGRYGEGKRFNFQAVCVTLLVHLVLFGGLLTLGVSMADKKSDRFVAFDLASPTPEQEPPEQQTPDVPQPQQLATAPSPVNETVPIVLPPTPIAIVTSAPPVVAQAPREPVEAAPAPPPARPAPPSTVTASDLGTRMISGRPPRYPVQSRRAREQGVVELLLVLGFDGAVENISVSRSSGFERLDEAALDAVRRWRWEPTLSGGDPVKVRGIVAIPFQLEG